MLEYNIYDDIAARTGGDIYIGVVGPVRTGKSTFIKKFMELSVLDKVTDKHKRARMVDELPQSADGRTIMTTEPKFVPNEAVTVQFDKMSGAIRLIDCVGYLVDGALGQTEGDKPRLVHTPWQEEEIPFEKAAEIGTEKVITEHSTIGILVTTDGSISEIGRAKYVDAEEKTVEKLKSCGKPFVIVLNSKTPENTDTVRLKESLSERYNVPVILTNVLEMTKEDVDAIVGKILLEFPIRQIRLSLPKWMRTLSFNDPENELLIRELKEKSMECRKMSDCDKLDNMFSECQLFVATDTNINLSDGTVDMVCTPDKQKYYDKLTALSQEKISDEYELFCYVKKLASSYRDYESIRKCMEQVKEDGYGVVAPASGELTLAEPEVVKKGNRYGIKLRAAAPSYHIVRVDVETEISPTIGSEQQGEDLAKGLLADYEGDKNALWNANMFGMSLSDLVRDDLQSKVNNVPADTRNKLRKTMTRIVNEGKGGVLCILL